MPFLDRSVRLCNWNRMVNAICLAVVCVCITGLTGCGSSEYDELAATRKKAIGLDAKFVEMEGQYDRMGSTPVTMRLPKGTLKAFEDQKPALPGEIPGLGKYFQQGATRYFSDDFKYNYKDAGGNEVNGQSKLPIMMTVCVIDNKKATSGFRDEVKRKYKAEWKSESVLVAKSAKNPKGGGQENCETTEYKVKGFRGNSDDPGQKNIEGMMQHVLLSKDKYDILISWRAPDDSKKYPHAKLMGLAKATAGTIEIESAADGEKEGKK
jgi:hypothetical protein